MSARPTIAARPSASSAWWRSIATAIRCGKFQRRASTPPTRAWSMPSWSRSSRRRCSGVLRRRRRSRTTARVQAARSRAGRRREGARRPRARRGRASRRRARSGRRRAGWPGRGPGSAPASAPSRRWTRRSRRRRGAGDRQHAGGLEHVDRLGGRRQRRRRPSAAVGGAQHRDRQGDVGLDRLDQLADRAAVSAVAARITRARDSIRTGKRSTASKRPPGGRPAPVSPASLRARHAASAFPLLLSFLGGMADSHAYIGSRGRSV